MMEAVRNARIEAEKQMGTMRETIALRAARRAAAPALEAQRIDEEAVDRFAAEMKCKLAAARAKGRGGWNTDECSAARLSEMLREHVEKGDPVDVANFCMMLQQRGERIE
jgi:hypothetical protein